MIGKPMHLTKKALLEAIANLPDDTPVVIGGELLTGVEIIRGRINADGGYYNPRFGRTDKGKALGIAFTHRTELSDGKVIDNAIV